jgi:outer membrane receptor protein involved in Fe transport
MKVLLLLLFFVLPATLIAQISGTVVDANTAEKLYGVRVKLSTGQNTATNDKGSFTITPSFYPCQVKFSLSGYNSDSVTVTKDTIIELRMYPLVQELKTVVVSASRNDQEIEEVPISMEIIKPALIDNKGLTNLEQVADQTPGVFAMDGQVSIRGGGGYAYGAGSRVLALWNGIPMTSPDVGDIKWNAIPMEQTSQIEVMKGASSVLYGSGALNGIISMVEKEPGVKPEYKFKVQTGIYDNPRRSSLKWWDTNPTFQLAEGYYGKQYGRTGMTIGFSGFRDKGYRQGEEELRGRINGSFSYRLSKYRLKLGMSYNFQYQDMGMFILWKSAEEALIPQDGTLSIQKSIRLNVDPYIKYIDKKDNTHYLRTRYYLVSTGNSEYVYASAKAEMYYADYQFQKQWKNIGSLTAGVTNSNNVINSTVFNDHYSNNVAAYTQVSRKLHRFDLTAGMRVEYFKMDTVEVDSKAQIGKLNLPVVPVFRTGTHYAATESTHLRASIGQGVRFPSVAERFVATSNGSVVVVPNPRLRPEYGWSAEAGVKQVMKIQKWKAMFDVVGFINEYNDMIEFNFGVYNPETFEQLDVLGDNPDTADLSVLAGILADGFTLEQLLGFQAQNTEKARITGVELSFNSTGKIKEVELVSLLGYTFMNPVSLNEDEDYAYWSSDSSNMLKYRFNHLAKADIESTYKNVSVGVSSRYSSYMRNIDRIFEEELPGGSYVLPGLKEYRQNNQTGNLVFDMRVAYRMKERYRLGLIVNNLFNAEYFSRPGDIQPPRNFILQFQYNVL